MINQFTIRWRPGVPPELPTVAAVCLQSRRRWQRNWTTDGRTDISGRLTSHWGRLTSPTWSDLADEITRQRHHSIRTPTAYLANRPFKKGHSIWKTSSHQLPAVDNFPRANRSSRRKKQDSENSLPGHPPHIRQSIRLTSGILPGTQPVR